MFKIEILEIPSWLSKKTGVFIGDILEVSRESPKAFLIGDTWLPKRELVFERLK